MTSATTFSLLDPALVKPAIASAFGKLDPRVQWRNPVMFVVYVGSIITTILWIQALGGQGEASQGFVLAIALWLWFTVLFANFAEAMAEGRSKAQASSLRGMKKKTIAKKLEKPVHGSSWHPQEADELRKGAVVLVEAGDVIPLDGEVIEGVASVDESAITGESAPVIRESGGDFCFRHRRHPCAVGLAGGAHQRQPGRELPRPHDRDGRRRQAPEDAQRDRADHPAGGADHRVPGGDGDAAAVTPSSASRRNKAGTPVTVTALIALLVCLIPTTIGALLSAIGVAGMSRMMAANVIATSGRAVEAAGDVDVLLLDKTGTITLGNRQASAFVPAKGVTEQQLADAAQFASMADETPEGRSITVLAKQKFNLRERDLTAQKTNFVPFTAQTRMSGVDIAAADGAVRALRKGAGEAIRKHVEALGGLFPADVQAATDDVARKGSTPLVVSDGSRVLGVVELKDIVKGGIKERFAELRRMGIKTVMITGDNRLTAAAIAAEAGVDDFLAEATPEAKLKMIRDYQADGRLVAMTGDGTNDAPALAQADVAVAMNTGTQAAKEAGNMVDLDSNPTKLLEIVETGKQLLMTRGSLTTFSIANDVAKYFAIIPAMFVTTYPALGALNVMGLASPNSAILSAVIFNALVIVFLIPLALKGVAYRAIGAAALLRRNVLIYGVGGLIVPFIGIKAIDLLLSAVHLV